MVEMNKNNLLWCCPRCGIINKWRENKCTKCHYSLNQGLAMMVVAEALESRIDIDTQDGIFSFTKR